MKNYVDTCFLCKGKIGLFFTPPLICNLKASDLFDDLHLLFASSLFEVSPVMCRLKVRSLRPKVIQEHKKSWNYELTQRQLRKIVNVDLRPTEKRKLFLQFFLVKGTCRWIKTFLKSLFRNISRDLRWSYLYYTIIWTMKSFRLPSTLIQFNLFAKVFTNKTFFSPSLVKLLRLSRKTFAGVNEGLNKRHCCKVNFLN